MVDPYVNVTLIESVEIAPNSAYTNQKKKMSPLIMFTLLLDRFELTVITSVGATNRRGVGASLTWQHVEKLRENVVPPKCGKAGNIWKS